MDREYTIVDPYALVFYGWGARGYPMKELAALDGMAGAHDKTVNGSEKCGGRAERFNIVIRNAYSCADRD